MHLPAFLHTRPAPIDGHVASDLRPTVRTGEQ